MLSLWGRSLSRRTGADTLGAAAGRTTGRRRLHSSLRLFAIVPHPQRVLCITEKEAIASQLAHILGNGDEKMLPSGDGSVPPTYSFDYRLAASSPPSVFTVTSVRGPLVQHSFDSVKAGEDSSPVSFFEAEITQSVRKGSEAIVDNLMEEAKRHDLLLVWTDCDRQGEKLAEEVAKFCIEANPGIRCLRARFNALVPEQIHQAVRDPVEIDDFAVAAVEAETELDLRAGTSITRLLTGSLSPVLTQEKVVSFTPSQSPILGFVVSRYLEASQEGDPKTLFSLELVVRHPEMEGPLTFKWNGLKTEDKHEIEEIHERCLKDPKAVVTEVSITEVKRRRVRPFTTVSLQKSVLSPSKTGYALVHLSPQKVLELAEKLYSRGLISFPKTEVDTFDRSLDFRPLLKNLVEHPAFGNDVQKLIDGEFEAPREGKVTSKTHTPIHPTSPWIFLPSDDERMIYDLIVQHFIKTCSRVSDSSKTTVTIEVAGESFSVSRDSSSASSDPALEDCFAINDVCKDAEVKMKEAQTRPLSLMSEKELVTFMGKNKIGTDAKTGQQIADLVARRYLTVVPSDTRVRLLKPSPLGIGLVEGWDKIGLEKSVSRPELRKETEEQLKKIAEGKLSKKSTVARALAVSKPTFEAAESRMDVLKELIQERELWEARKEAAATKEESL